MPRPPIRIRTKNNKMNLVGESIKVVRRKDNLSQDQLCGRISEATGGMWGPTPDDIYRIETGTRIVSDLELIAIAAALNTEFECLIKWDDNNLSTKELAKRIFVVE